MRRNRITVLLQQFTKNNEILKNRRADKCTDPQNETTTTGSDYSLGKGICGAWLFGPTGLLCGLCSDGKTVSNRHYWVFFFIYRNDEKKMWDSFLIIAAVEIIAAQLLAIFLSDCAYGMLFQFGALLVMPLIKYCYNGKPGSRHMFHRWFFYVFYPLHLLLLFLLKLYLHG